MLKISQAKDKIECGIFTHRLNILNIPLSKKSEIKPFMRWYVGINVWIGCTAIDLNLQIILMKVESGPMILHFKEA